MGHGGRDGPVPHAAVRNLPEAVLAALIIHALWHILVARKLQRVRLISWDGSSRLGVITFLGVILIDVLQGMLLGLLCSILLVVYRTSRPHLSSLGRVPGVPGAFSDMTRDRQHTRARRADPASRCVDVLCQRPHGPRPDEGPGGGGRDAAVGLIFDAAAEDTLDVTSADVIKGLVKEFQGQGITVYAVEVHAPVIEFGRKSACSTCSPKIISSRPSMPPRGDSRVSG